MSGIADLLELITQRINELIPVQTVWATCKSVNWDAKTMVAIGQTDDLEYEDVLLGNGVRFSKPKPGTICLLGVIQNNEALTYLIDADEVEEYHLITDKTLFKQALNGFVMKRNTESLKELLQDLMNEVNKLNKELQKVSVSIGVTPNVVKLKEIETAVSQINERTNQLFIE